LTILFLMTLVPGSSLASTTDSDDFWFTWSDTVNIRMRRSPPSVPQHRKVPPPQLLPVATSSLTKVVCHRQQKIFRHHQVLLVAQFLCCLHSGPTSSELSRRRKAAQTPSQTDRGPTSTPRKLEEHLQVSKISHSFSVCYRQYTDRWKPAAVCLNKKLICLACPEENLW